MSGGLSRRIWITWVNGLDGQQCRGLKVAALLSGIVMSHSVSSVTAVGDDVSPPVNSPVCCLELADVRTVLGNGLCRIVWTRRDAGWQSEYQLNGAGEWHSLAYDAPVSCWPYEIVEKDFEDAKGEFADRFRVPQLWTGGTVPVRLHSGSIPSAARPDVEMLSDEQIRLRWTFDLAPANSPADWRIDVSHTIRRGDFHVHEVVRYTRMSAGRPVRLRRGWYVRNLPPELLASTVRSITQMGFRLPEGTFVALATHDRSLPWTPYAGGGGFVADRYDMDLVTQSIHHQVPPCMETAGWVELRPGETYTLQHFLIMHPTYPFEREFLDYLHRLQPLEYLPPRYSLRHFVDKCIFALRYTTDAYEDGGDWGHYYKNWYNLTSDPHVSNPQDPSRRGQPYLDRTQSLDWGASWDIWNAYLLLIYGRKYDDEWCLDRYQKLRNGIVMNPWQIDQPGTLTDGAFWMERDARGFHISNWMKNDQVGNRLWVCDTAKVGYFLCKLAEQTNDAVLLEKAKRAAAFLLRIRKSNGDLTASVLSEEGDVIVPSNFGGTVSAVMLWAELFRLTQEDAYRDAAVGTADFCISTWMAHDQWQMLGGEADKPQLPCATAAMYAVMSMAALAEATDSSQYREATSKAANYLLCQQWLFDINYGYYRQTARWHGTDFKTAGSLQGWIRPECTLCLYVAWKATGDPLYRSSCEQHIHWMTYMQYDDLDDRRTFGGGSEYLQYLVDNLNGFGSNFFPETAGQAIGVLLLMDEPPDLEQRSP